MKNGVSEVSGLISNVTCSSGGGTAEGRRVSGQLDDSFSSSGTSLTKKGRTCATTIRATEFDVAWRCFMQFLCGEDSLALQRVSRKHGFLDLKVEMSD